MDLFKFFYASAENAVMKDETVRLGTFGSYRSMEEVDLIGDRQEGHHVQSLKTTVMRDTPQAHLDLLREKARVDIRESDDIKLDLTVVNRQPDAYLFCCSAGDLTALKKGVCIPARYDRGYRIKEIDHFAQAIWERGVIRNSIERPFRESAGKPTQGLVTYSDDVPDLLLGRAFNPFAKRLRYKGQSEYRVVYPSLSQASEYLIVHVPGMRELIEPVDLS